MDFVGVVQVLPEAKEELMQKEKRRKSFSKSSRRPSNASQKSSDSSIPAFFSENSKAIAEIQDEVARAADTLGHNGFLEDE